MANSVYASDATKRLIWRIPATLETAISVSANPHAPRGQIEPYFGRTLSGGRWHDLCQEPVSYPPQQSIKVTVSQLNDWDSQWEESHEHAEPDDEGCEFAPGDDDGPGELLKCCGEERPQAPAPLVVTANEKAYVTIHDYVSAVHPWLMEHINAISAAVNVWTSGEAPQGQKLFVNMTDLTALDICDEQRWQMHDSFGPSSAEHFGPEGITLARPVGWPPVHAVQMSPEGVRELNAQLRAQGRNLQYPEL